jgi:glycerol-3-phosphate acyltransferase PlsY
MLIQLIPLTIGAYLLGAIPTSYIAGRLLRGIDIRNYGSGVASASNVWHSVSRWSVVPVGIFDVLKGAIPVAIAYYVLGFDIWAAGIVGLAAIAGHSWSIFLGFDGGRGFATMIGVLLIIAPWELLLFIVICLLGIALLKNSPLWMILGAAAMPLASLAWYLASLDLPGESAELERVWVMLGMLLLIILKRLLAERTIPLNNWKRVMLCRLLLDRDTRDREAWIYRDPINMKDPAQKK